MGKLWKIHFRNVTSPVPDFVETYIDNGYTDMWKLMKTLLDVDFRGNLIADHVPPMAGARQSAWSYSIGYIRALYNSAREEKAVSSRRTARCNSLVPRPRDRSP
jgi:mannonate dehydratase